MQVIIEAILWTYSKLKNDQFAIQMRFTHYKDVKYLSTGFSANPETWDAKNNLPLPSHSKYKAVLKKISSLTDDADFEIRLAEKNGESLTMAELKQRVSKKQAPASHKKILEFYDEVIADMESQGRTGYADVFTSSKATISKLLKNVDKRFTAFTEKDFKQYESFINSLKSESTKSIYLRTLYRLWNIAIKEKHCPEKHHPKFHIGFKPYKRIKTKKRAIPFDYIKKIEEIQFDTDSRLFRSQQYCIFSYYSRGINFTDMAKLKKKLNIHRGNICYKRSKNKRNYDFALHPKAQKVVEIFADYPLQSDADYVFPILLAKHKTARQIDTRIDSALKDFNEDLGTMEEMIESPKHITSYTLRHSFATSLRNKKVDIAIIKEAMGHETEMQTNAYLEEIDDTLIASSIEEALQ
ncbi:MAG TPA: tyrosine-type recombinase/integrase [Chitinophagaceae bacterium]|nr:tyrosine-type recombinase/integrase [Chitinophagaceae bacterium]